jgi:Holliday junction resolvase RusA-like endonuclease
MTTQAETTTTIMTTRVDHPDQPKEALCKKGKQLKNSILFWTSNADIFCLDQSTLKFTVHGEPKPQPRPRWSGRSRGMYIPNATHRTEFIKAVKSLLPEVLNPPIFGSSCALELKLVFHLKRPLGHFVANKRTRSLKTEYKSQISSQTVSDIDNLTKFVQDCLSKLVYHDDKQVVSLQAVKIYGNGDASLGKIDVCVRVISEEQLLRLTSI